MTTSTVDVVLVDYQMYSLCAALRLYRDVFTIQNLKSILKINTESSL